MNKLYIPIAFHAQRLPIAKSKQIHVICDAGWKFLYCGMSGEVKLCIKWFSSETPQNFFTPATPKNVFSPKFIFGGNHKIQKLCKVIPRIFIVSS